MVGQHIRQRIKDEELSLIMVPAGKNGGISWITEGKEFRYKGEMFDVIRIENKLNKRYLYCIKDKKEKELLANYLKTTKSKKDSDKKQKRVLTERYFPHELNINKLYFTSQVQYVTIIFSLQSNCLIIPAPPPKLT